MDTGDRRAVVRHVLPRIVAPLLLLFALAAWAVASPVGAAPDDDFHLASIWCATGDDERCIVATAEVRNSVEERPVDRSGDVVVVTGAVAWVAIPWAWGAGFTESRLLLIILLPGSLAYAMIHVMTPLMIQLRKARALSSVQAVSLLLNVTIGVLFVPYFGALASACASTVAFVLSSIAIGAVLSRSVNAPVRERLLLNRGDLRFIARRLSALGRVVHVRRG